MRVRRHPALVAHSYGTKEYVLISRELERKGAPKLGAEILLLFPAHVNDCARTLVKWNAVTASRPEEPVVYDRDSSSLLGSNL